MTGIVIYVEMGFALNYEEALKQSKYAELVAEMRNSSEYLSKDKANKETLPASVGQRNGLKLTLDLHSNSESLGTVSEDFFAFRVSISKNPVLRRSHSMVVLTCYFIV